MKFECNYPEGFYSFENGVDVSNSQINQWIKECIDNLEKNKTSNVSSMSSGNTLVVVFRCYYKDNDPQYYYNVIVTKNYSEKDIDLDN